MTMKVRAIFKIVVLLLFFWELNFNGIANETLRFTIQGHADSFLLTASIGKQFTVDWGNGFIDTLSGTGEPQYVNNSHPFFPCITFYNIVVTGSCSDCKFSSIRVTRVTSFDASEAPSLIKIDLSNFTADYMILTYCNLNNCSSLEELQIASCSLRNLDLSNCTSLNFIYVPNNKFSKLDISNTEAEYCTAAHNCLPLSQLFPITTKLPHPEWSYNYKQVVATRYATVNEPVDFSSEKEFDGVATYFLPRIGNGLGAWPPAPESDYTINDGLITFHTARTYTVYMENSKIIGADGVYTFTPVVVIQPIHEIINVPSKAIAGTSLTLTGTVIPNDATFKSISWCVKDTGTTGAIITSNKLITKTGGTVIVNATIKNGLGIGSNYIQDFSIEVTPLGINDPTQELSNITIYPNPTTGELEIETKNLQINKIEVFDINEKMLLSHHFNILSVNHRIDISNLNSGNYFIKVITTQGEIVKKIVKL